MDAYGTAPTLMDPGQAQRPYPGTMPPIPGWLVGLVAIGVIAVGAWFVFSSKKKDDDEPEPKTLKSAELAKNPKKRRPRPNRLKKNGRFYGGGKTDCHGSAKSSGDYLFPAEKKYPVPNLKCAHRALTFAAWPNNIEDAPRVIAAMKKSRFGSDAGIRMRMAKLRETYDREKRAGRVAQAA